MITNYSRRIYAVALMLNAVARTEATSARAARNASAPNQSTSDPNCATIWLRVNQQFSDVQVHR
jgi:hypothetical protein